MFKTFYGLAFKNYFIDSETYEVYHNKYLSDNLCGWFLIVSVDGGATWEKMQQVFCELGYSFKWQILNAKNYGIPPTAKA